VLRCGTQRIRVGLADKPDVSPEEAIPLK